MLINCVAYQEGKKLSDIPVEDISEYLKQPGCFVWVALRDASDAEIEAMFVDKWGYLESQRASRRAELVAEKESRAEVPADLFEQVKRNPKWRDVPYVFMSSLDDYDARHTAKVLGADDYVEKPIDTDQVRSIVLNLLTRFSGRP